MRTYTADEVDAMIGRALARERERVAQQQMPDDWFKGMPEEYRRAAWRIKEQPAQSSKPFDTHTAPGQFFDTHSRTPQQKLVPYEPSIDMQEQGSIASGYDLSQARAKKVYQAMIDMHDVMMEREPTDEWFRLQAGYPEQPAQPSKPWVGLTEQEAAECWSTSTVRTWQAIEAKLREKNNG